MKMFSRCRALISEIIGVVKLLESTVSFTNLYERLLESDLVEKSLMHRLTQCIFSMAVMLCDLQQMSSTPTIQGLPIYLFILVSHISQAFKSFCFTIPFDSRISLQTTMAETIAYGMLANILSTMTSHAFRQIGSAILVEKELKKLKRTLITINNVLRDADEQQLINNHALKGWVKDIKEVCYEAEDVLDDFATEALRRKLKVEASTLKKVWSFAYSVKSISFYFKMSGRIKEIRQNFDGIEDNKNKFHLSSKVVLGDLDRGRQTHSWVLESEVLGREGDKNNIINLLSNGDDGLVVAIVGMGGLGKTTLAKLVYNDKEVDDIFEKKIWVGVYQKFSVKTILENIIKSATKKECTNLELDQLGSLFQDELKGTKFLLVLDDVWNESYTEWDNLKSIVSIGVKGSKVVVTTRSIGVADVMEAKPYILKELSSDDCWRLFEKGAFAGREKHQYAKLAAIGKDIVSHCHGVPLAAKALGSSMHSKTEKHEWEAVRDSEIWRLSEDEDKIMPVLRLSYNHLPFYLKQCFEYFATFREDSNYIKNRLIESWIAHGFICPSSDSQSLEELGNKYVNELQWRSLIQEPEHDSCGNLISFKVHPLLYNLARDVAGTECFIFEEGITPSNPEDIRYAEFYSCPSYSDVQELLGEMPNLRELSVISDRLDEDIIRKLKSLRCLWTNSCPISVGRLKHLRKLYLHGEHRSVPASVTNLLNLQTLDFSSCLKLGELPKDTGKMIYLRHVILAESSPMSHMPLGFKYLTSLRSLPVFFVGKGVGCKLNELHGLNLLEGRMTIKNIENVCDAKDCAEVNLGGKKRLGCLKFSWNNREGDEAVNKERSVDVLENLQPHSDLKILQIDGYMGSRFASWMMKPLFTELLEVSLVKCKNVGSLHPFGELPSLEYLRLEDMDRLKCVEGEGGNGRREWFPSLKRCYLVNLGNLKSLGLKDSPRALPSLPSLEEMTIIRCPRLDNMPLLPSLERLEVSFCREKLVHSLLKLPGEKATTTSLTRLKQLKIKECHDLISLPKNWSRILVSLEELVIKKCISLVSFDDEGSPDSSCLTLLKISELPCLVYLPQWMQNSTKLQKLKIRVCDGLIDAPDWFWELTSLRHLYIANCPKLKLLPDGMQKLAALEFLGIAFCGSLMSWPNGLGSLTSLKELYIGCMPGVPSLPEQLQQLTALRGLAISNCQTMLALPEWLLNFTSLQQFRLDLLEKLQCLPDWLSKLPALQYLDIDKCDELTSRCQKGTGVDWPKIAHIPYIKLNGHHIQKAS